MKVAALGRMKEYAPGVRPSELSLVEVLPTSGKKAAAPDALSDGAPAAAPPPADEHADTSASAIDDRFILRATKEHAEGHIDPSLWSRAFAQAKGDKVLATRLYLTSRATALRVAKRQDSAARRANVVEALSNAPWPGFESEARASSETASQNPSPPLRAGASPSRRRIILAAAAFGSVLVIAGSLFVLWPTRGPAQQSAARAAAPADVSGPLAPSAIESTRLPQASGENVVGKVQALEKAGNWNLLVIYATEWTRKQPSNVEAWRTLSVGYAKLRQFREAVDAGSKAIQLAPEDFLLWQNLGQINLAVPRPAEALVAFQRAAALNERDVVSLAQVGIISTQLGQLAQAKVAFDQALALSPEDVTTLCGAASLAQKEGRAKDAEAFTLRATSGDGRCPDPPTVTESTRVIVSAPVQPKPKSPPVRRPH
jgi:tetratricopeptide (TPR) repeat protein